MRKRLILMLASCLIVGAKPVLGITIDDFSVGPIIVERTGASGVTQLQSGLDPEHVIGGSRRFIVGDSGAVGQAAEVDTVARELRFYIDLGLGYHRLTYGADAPLSLDLIATGHDAFQLDFIDAVGQPPLWLTVSSPVGGNVVSETVSLVAVPVMTLSNGVKRALFDFGWFSGIDLTNVSSIELHSVRVGRDMTLKSLSTVIPEPSSVLLVALGSATVAFCSRRSSKFAAGERGRV